MTSLLRLKACAARATLSLSLVAGNAGPLWTPIFPTVAAVVLDQGVLFQHAMLTCREYGVPAVFQTKDASRKLREGQRVIVDGDHGWILPAG